MISIFTTLYFLAGFALLACGRLYFYQNQLSYAGLRPFYPCGELYLLMISLF